MTYEDKDLAARVISLLLDPNTLSANWGVYLFSLDFDDEPELRNKICVIWICALMDCVEAEERVLQSYLNQASSNDYSNMIQCCFHAQRFYEAVKELLSTFSMREQLFLQDIRDQVVHGWLNKKHLKEFSVKWVEDGGLQRKTIGCDEFRDLVRFGYERSILRDIRHRFCDQSLAYWKEVAAMTEPGFNAQLKKAVYSDIGIVHDGS